MNKYTMTALMCMMMASYSYSAPNRDGCVNMADPCVCLNTNVKGFCFPGSHSTSGELYCNCQANVYSPYEATYEWFKQYVLAPQNIVDAIYKKYAAQLWESAYIIAEVRTDLGLPTGVNPKQQGIDLAPSYNAFVKNTQSLPILGEFFKLRDGCSYINQPCTCSNSRTQGICSMNYPTEGKAFEKGQIYCHCD